MPRIFSKRQKRGRKRVSHETCSAVFICRDLRLWKLSRTVNDMQVVWSETKKLFSDIRDNWPKTHFSSRNNCSSKTYEDYRATQSRRPVEVSSKLCKVIVYTHSVILVKTYRKCGLVLKYVPPSEWIMCELVFFHFFGERSFKSRQIPSVDLFFRQEKTSKDSKRRFSIYCNWVLWSMDCLQLPFIRVEEAVSWTQRFLTRKIWPKNRRLFMTNKFGSKCLQKFFFSSK